MKRIVSAILAGAMALGLAACGGSAASTSTAASASAAGSTAVSQTESDLDYIKGKGKLVIGYTVYGYRTVYDADGNYLYELSEPGGVYYLHAESIDWPEEKLSEDEYIGALEQLTRAG